MNNEKIEVGDVVEVTQTEHPDAVMRGKVRWLSSEGDVGLDGFVGYLDVGTYPERYNVKILEKAKRKHRVGDAYLDDKRDHLRYLVCVGEDRWVYTISAGSWVDLDDQGAEKSIRDHRLILRLEGPTNDEL